LNVTLDIGSAMFKIGIFVTGPTEADSDTPAKTPVCTLHLTLRTLHLTFSSLFTSHIINYLYYKIFIGLQIAYILF